MNERYALFIYEEFEAAGGLHDLVKVGSLEECIAAAEADPRRVCLAEIADLSTMSIIRTGRWKRAPSPLTGQPPTEWYEWTD